MINKIGGTFTSVSDFKDEGFKESTSQYTQYGLIRNGPIRNASEILGFFKTWLVKKSFNYPPDLEETPLVNFFNLRNS